MFSGKVFQNIILNFEIFNFSGLWGGGGSSRFASRQFPTSVPSASCNLAGRPFCLLRMFYCFFSFHLLTKFQLQVVMLFSLGYSLTNERKTGFFNDSRCFLAISSLVSKLIKNNQSIFSGTKKHPNVFLSDYSGLCLLRGLFRISLYLNSIHPFLHCIFRFQQFFTNLISSDFAHIPNFNINFNSFGYVLQ